MQLLKELATPRKMWPSLLTNSSLINLYMNSNDYCMLALSRAKAHYKVSLCCPGVSMTACSYSVYKVCILILGQKPMVMVYVYTFHIFLERVSKFGIIIIKTLLHGLLNE